jgi:hypothetical protein
MSPFHGRISGLVNTSHIWSDRDSTLPRSTFPTLSRFHNIPPWHFTIISMSHKKIILKKPVGKLEKIVHNTITYIA